MFGNNSCWLLVKNKIFNKNNIKLIILGKLMLQFWVIIFVEFPCLEVQTALMYTALGMEQNDEWRESLRVCSTAS